MATNSSSKADDGNSSIGGKRSDVASRPRKQAIVHRAEIAEVSRVERDAGDQVNRFLLCTLVSESSKRIKASVLPSGDQAI